MSAWISHEHREEACGCGFVVTMYSRDPDAGKYADGSDRVTVYRCAGHGGSRHDATFHNRASA